MTNMSASEMVPDTLNAAHDPRYWCLPPQRDSPNVVVGEPNKGKHTFYLVSQGYVVGTWRNWTVAKAMISGFSGAAHRGHRTYEGCVNEWQQHCALGVHPHPVDPALGATERTDNGPPAKGDKPAAPAPARLPSWKGKAVDPALQAEMKKYCMPNLPEAGPSRAADDDADNVGPRPGRYSAIWGGRIVFCSCYEARCAFLAAEERGLEPQLLSTDNFTEAQDYSECIIRDLISAIFGRCETGACADELEMSMSTPSPIVVRSPAPSSPSREGGASPTRSVLPEDASGTEILKPVIPAVESAGPESWALDAQGPGEATAENPYSMSLGEYRPAVIVRPVEKRSKKRKKGDDKKKRGKPSWVWGTKLQFFKTRKEKWLAAVDTNQTGGFYTTMAKLYVRKYGYHIADNEDLAEEVADPPDEAANVVVNERLSAEEAESRSKYHAGLRLDKEAFAGLFTRNLDGTPPRPQRPQLIQFYSRKFYEDRIRVRFEARMAGIVRRAAFTDDDMPAALKVRNEVTKEVWEEETEAFQQEVKTNLEREYQASLAAWKNSLADSPTKTPEEMNATLQNAAFYLQPYVDAIQERFGMCASVFLAGPIGARGGMIGVRSVHAGKTTGAVPMKWPDFDVPGFAAAEASMVMFAREHFTDADCRARAIDGTVESDPSSWQKEPSTRGVEKGTELGAGGGGTGPTAQKHGDGEKEGGVPENGMAGDGGAAAEGGNKGDGGNDVAGDNTDGERGVEGGDKGGGDDGEAERKRKALKADKKRAQAMWKRRDRADWSPELTRAHAGFERGKSWGIEWATCVKEFYNFERSRGYHGNPISTKSRPELVKAWLAKGRHWDVSPELGELGGRGVEGSFVEAWWGWWIGMQPQNRKVREGVLDEASDHHWWYILVKIGWGDKRGLSEFTEWAAAVDDVMEVLRQLQDMREEDDPRYRVTPPLPSKRNRSPAEEEDVDER
ncbi:hypothetical protein C8J57DRAFT_1494238 [Mycena rebaudengoi]|nr:hypothetical protein C8J57DRAFT_1494238 [Mycena rebaudengoi]